MFSVPDPDKTSAKAMPALEPLRLSLPESWRKQIRSVVNVAALAEYATAKIRSWAANGCSALVRFRAYVCRFEQEVTAVRAVLRIKEASLARTSANRRPHYVPIKQMRIVELRASHNELVIRVTSEAGGRSLTGQANHPSRNTNRVFYDEKRINT